MFSDMAAALISVQNLTHSYGEGTLRREVLHSISVDFYPSEIAIIMGPSGGGKTTFLSLAGALRSVQSGSIRLNGAELKDANARTLTRVRRQIGFVFQAHNLVESLTICENVQIALTVDDKATAGSSERRAMELLARVGLADHARKRPRQLSGGQKQRVAIARALVRSPQIIMADEPTAALDRTSGREVVELLKHLAKEMNCSVLLVTHDNRILDIADRILTLEDGYIEESNLALDRLVGQVSGIMELLEQYPSQFSVPGALAGPSAAFRERLNADVPRLADLVARRQPESLAIRSQRWAEIADDLRYLEESLCQMPEALSACDAASEGIELCDSVAQSLEFLLRTAAAGLRTRAGRDIDTVVSLTANHAAVQENLRRSFEERHTGAPEQSRNSQLDLISLYFRCVFFLHHICERAATDIATTPPPPAS
jgi:putative ABC transport system ATP-binding protein